jgi:hypothetical protein
MTLPLSQIVPVAIVIGLLLWGGHQIFAGALFFAAIILDAIRRVEVKVNRLLGDRGIVVTDKDIRDAE